MANDKTPFGLNACGLQGDWMQTYSGRAFYPLDPRPDQFTIEDLAAGMACERRYGGHGKLWMHYSVAEHCVIGMHYFLKRGMLMEAIAFLFHDAAEGLVKDLPRALKRAVRPSYDPVEAGVEAVILEKYLPADPWRKIGVHQVWNTVKEIDNRILVNEKHLLMRHNIDWGTHFNALEPLPKEDFPVNLYQPAEAFSIWLGWARQLAASNPTLLNLKGE